MSYELIEEAEDLIAEILEAVEDYEDAELEEVTSADPWSAAWIIHHLADAELHLTIRIVNALTLDKPNIITWDEETYPDILNYTSRDISASVMAIEGCDAYLSDVLRNQAEGNFSRKTIHPYDGEKTVTDLLKKLIDHRTAHLAQLRSVLAAL